ncbi:hypothetical protein, partial [Acinetobacter baumannii]|uniref:hypothetical protein n=1 Tax=Acinetobacter baumannii TaxID=470 RepID=UPI001178376C
MEVETTNEEQTSANDQQNQLEIHKTETKATILELLQLAKAAIVDAEPLLVHVKQKILDYSSKFKTDNVVMVGSVGNGFFFP